MAERPKRIQRQRTKGWRMPDGAVYVGRPGKWGNPFPVSGDYIMWATVARGRYNNDVNRRLTAVELFRSWLTDQRLPPASPARKDDLIVYESGIALSTDEVARGIAATCAMLNAEELKVQRPPEMADLIAELRGRDLVCWCPLDQPCHADVLLELANG